MTILELISEIKKGSVAAEQCLFNKYSGRLQILCRRYVKNFEDAEEVCMDGFFKFFTTISSFIYKGDASLYAWLHKMMIYECLTYLKKRNSFIIISDADATDIPIQEDVIDSLAAEEIYKYIVQLPVGYRTVFNLFVFEGMEHREIASMLGIKEGTSKSQLAKAKNLLQKILLLNGIEYVKQQSK